MGSRAVSEGAGLPWQSVLCGVAGCVCKDGVLMACACSQPWSGTGGIWEQDAACVRCQGEVDLLMCSGCCWLLHIACYVLHPVLCVGGGCLYCLMVVVCCVQSCGSAKAV